MEIQTVEEALDLPLRCANIDCSNKPHEGAFLVVCIGTEGADQRLFMCSPCAHRLNDWSVNE